MEFEIKISLGESKFKKYMIMLYTKNINISRSDNLVPIHKHRI